MANVIDIIPRDLRGRGLWVAFTLLLRAGLNFIGLAMLLPLLALVLAPEGFTGDGPLKRVYEMSGLQSEHSFALAVCIAGVAVIAAKSLICLWLARSERKYIYELYRTLSRQLYTTYHDRGLPFIKASNSATLSRNVNVVCLSFAVGVLKPAAAIAAEAMLLLMLCAVIAIYTPIAALFAVIAVAPAAWLYYGVVRKRINHYGEAENRAQREKNRTVAETFRGFSDIEINGAFPMMLRNFDRAMDQVVTYRRKEAGIGMLPQVMTEIGVAAGLGLFAAVSFGSENPSSQLLFGVFAVAALRLMPSVRNILSGWTTIKFNRYSIDTLHEADIENRQLQSFVNDRLPFEREILVRDLGFEFPDNGQVLFSGLDLSIAKGERIGIRGTSGAGKTTLFNLLLGFYEPTAGEIAIDGVRLTPVNRRAWQNRIGYVSQNLFLTDGSFAANVALGVPEEEVDRERAIKVLEAAQLGDFIAALPKGIDTHIGECGCRLSGGQRQRIGIARALYRQADVLFFDEATSALDSRTEEEINRSIARLAENDKGLTLVVIAHRESSLEYCTRIITLGEDEI